MQTNTAYELQTLVTESEADHKGNALELHGDRLITPTHHRDAPKGWKTNTRRNDHDQN